MGRLRCGCDHKDRQHHDAKPRRRDSSLDGTRSNPPRD
jgi:hypothetical protein